MRILRIYPNVKKELDEFFDIPIFRLVPRLFQGHVNHGGEIRSKTYAFAVPNLVDGWRAVLRLSRFNAPSQARDDLFDSGRHTATKTVRHFFEGFQRAVLDSLAVNPDDDLIATIFRETWAGDFTFLNVFQPPR